MIPYVKSLTSVWPFFKEVVLGDYTFRESLRIHRKRVMTLLLLISLFFSTSYLFQENWKNEQELSVLRKSTEMKYLLDLQKRISELETDLWNAHQRSPPGMICVSPNDDITEDPIVGPSKSPEPIVINDPYLKLLEDFE